MVQKNQAPQTPPAIVNPGFESNPLEGIHVVARGVPYRLSSLTLRMVSTEMKRIGPLDDGGHQVAFTWVRLAWTYPFARDDHGCRTGPVNVEVEVVQTLPEWALLSRASPPEAAEWRRFLDALRNHEDGHRSIGMEAAREIRDAVRALGVLPTCGDVDAAANALGQGALERMRARSKEFDRLTQHGATTGARLGS